MKLTVAAFLLAVPAVAGRRSHGKIHRGTKAVRPTKRMMRNAKHIGGHKIRHLEDANQNQNQQQEERDVTWMHEYSIQFDSCHSATTVRQEGGGDEFGALIANNSIEFTLCPTSGGNGCARYLAPMMDFLNAYTEAQMEEEEYECELAREQCEYEAQMNQNNNQNNNGNYNEQYYMNECYQAMGKNYCMEYEGQEEFEVQRYLECAEFEGNSEYVNYFIGPYCASNGKEVRLGMFQDGGCAVPASNGLETFSKYSYGRSLPFSDESIVSRSKTISCKQVDQDANNNQNNQNGNNNNNNNNYNYNQDIEINQFCEEIYQISAKCEKGLNKESNYYWSPDNEACSYIEKTLPAMDAATFGAGAGSASKAFAWIFALSTVGLGGYVFYLHKNKDRKVDLSSQGDAAQA